MVIVNSEGALTVFKVDSEYQQNHLCHALGHSNLTRLCSTFLRKSQSARDVQSNYPHRGHLPLFLLGEVCVISIIVQYMLDSSRTIQPDFIDHPFRSIDEPTH
jgi:hypothetical protein